MKIKRLLKSFVLAISVLAIGCSLRSIFDAMGRFMTAYPIAAFSIIATLAVVGLTLMWYYFLPDEQ